jgi:hypothetical protein
LFEGIEVEVGEEGEGVIACVSGAGVNQAASATAAKVTGGRARISFLRVRLLDDFILSIVQFYYLCLNKVQIYF